MSPIKTALVKAGELMFRQLKGERLEPLEEMLLTMTVKYQTALAMIKVREPERMQLHESARQICTCGHSRLMHDNDGFCEEVCEYTEGPYGCSCDKFTEAISEQRDHL